MTFYQITSQVKNALRRYGSEGSYESDIQVYSQAFSDKHRMLFTAGGEPRKSLDTILIFSMLNSSYCMQIESILAKKFDRMGFKIVVLTSGRFKHLSDAIHKKIYGIKNVLYLEDFLRLRISSEARRLIDSVRHSYDLAMIKGLRYRNVFTGLHSLATYSGINPSGRVMLDRKTARDILRICYNSCRITEGIERVLNKEKPGKIIGLEKGIVGVCELFYESIFRGLDYIQWVSCHEPNSIMLKRYTTRNYRAHPFSVSEETWKAYKGRNDNYWDIVMGYFKRGYLEGEWFSYKKLATSKVVLNKEKMVSQLRLNSRKKTAVIFSHILNDANFFYGEDLFENGFSEWLVKTIEAAGRNKEVNWLLKLHPANVYRRTNSNYRGEYGELLAIKEGLGKIPDTITVVPPDIDINPYSFFQSVDYGITVRGTIGAELPCFGIPVLTAGTGRYSGRGFTIDSLSRDEYLDKVSNIHLISRLSAQQQDLALKHAYLFFKERPAKYDTVIRDIYPYPVGHPVYRDIEIIDRDIMHNEQLTNICNFIAHSQDEDYLATRRY